MSPALADIIGGRRVWTVAMISSGVNALEVDAGRAQVGAPQLALDDVERHAFAGEFERVRVAHWCGADLRRTPARVAARWNSLRTAAAD